MKRLYDLIFPYEYEKKRLFRSGCDWLVLVFEFNRKSDKSGKTDVIDNIETSHDKTANKYCFMLNFNIISLKWHTLNDLQFIHCLRRVFLLISQLNL